MSIAATDASGAIRFYSGGATEAARIHASRGVSIGDTTDPGATNFRVAGTITSVGTITGTLATAAQPNITSVGTLTSLGVTGTVTAGAFSGPLTGNVTGNVSGSAATVTGAAQSAITSVGTLTGLTVSGTVSLVASGNLTDSNGTPTIAAGFGTGASVVGTDYGMLIQTGTNSAATGTITFGKTYAHAPICVAIAEYIADIYIQSVSTTQVVIGIGNGTVNDKKIWVLVRGY